MIAVAAVLTLVAGGAGTRLDEESIQSGRTGEEENAPNGEVCGLGANGLVAGAPPNTNGAAAPRAGACT